MLDKEITNGNALIFSVNNKKENIKLDLTQQNIEVNGYVGVTLEKLTNKGDFDFYMVNYNRKKDEGYYFVRDYGKWKRFDDNFLNYYFKMGFEISGK